MVFQYKCSHEVYMKKVSMYFILFLTILSVSIGMGACKELSKTYITEDDIWNIMDDVEVATVEKDIDGVMKHLAPSVVIHVTVSSPYGPQKVPMSREEYEKETLKGWSMTSDYEYRCENEEIKLSDDGQTAVVETDVVESYMLKGEPIHTRIRERVTLQVLDGEILVTRIDAFMKMQEVI
jgi:hypothetical protein